MDPIKDPMAAPAAGLPVTPPAPAGDVNPTPAPAMPGMEVPTEEAPVGDVNPTPAPAMPGMPEVPAVETPAPDGTVA